MFLHYIKIPTISIIIFIMINISFCKYITYTIYVYIIHIHKYIHPERYLGMIDV